MKDKRSVPATLMVMVMILTAACATTDHAKIKKQAEAIRGVGEAYMLERNYTAALRELLKAEKMNPDDHLLVFSGRDEQDRVLCVSKDGFDFH